MLGGIRCARAYYYCGRCGRGFFAFNAQAGFQGQHLTAGAERVVSLLGLLGDGFEDAARRVLPEATGLHLGESTAQHSCEDAGDRLGEWLDQGATLGDDLAFDWHEDARGRRCAYVSLDATSVPPQGPEAGPAEGRMPYGAMLYNPAPEPAAKPAHPSLPTPGYEPVNEAPAAGGRTGSARPADEPRAAMEARYLAGLYELGEWGVLLRRQAAPVGMEQADLWSALADAGGGLEDFLRRNFNRPDLVVLRDFHHPTGYLERRALAGHGPGTEAARTQAERWWQRLKGEGGAAVLGELRACRAHGGPRCGRPTTRPYAISRTTTDAGTTRITGRRGGRSAAARWRAPARRWWANG